MPSQIHPDIQRWRFCTDLYVLALARRRDDLGAPDRFDVYYGMADNRIGVARLDMSDVLLAGGDADAPNAKV